MLIARLTCSLASFDVPESTGKLHGMQKRLGPLDAIDILVDPLSAISSITGATHVEVAVLQRTAFNLTANCRQCTFAVMNRKAFAGCLRVQSGGDYSPGENRGQANPWPTDKVAVFAGEYRRISAIRTIAKITAHGLLCGAASTRTLGCCTDELCGARCDAELTEIRSINADDRAARRERAIANGADGLSAAADRCCSGRCATSTSSVIVRRRARS